MFIMCIVQPGDRTVILRIQLNAMCIEITTIIVSGTLWLIPLPIGSRHCRGVTVPFTRNREFACNTSAFIYHVFYYNIRATTRIAFILSPGSLGKTRFRQRVQQIQPLLNRILLRM